MLPRLPCALLAVSAVSLLRKQFKQLISCLRGSRAQFHWQMPQQQPPLLPLLPPRLLPLLLLLLRPASLTMKRVRKTSFQFRRETSENLMRTEAVPISPSISSIERRMAFLAHIITYRDLCYRRTWARETVKQYVTLRQLFFLLPFSLLNIMYLSLSLLPDFSCQKEGAAG